MSQLFHFPLSTTSQKVRLCLTWKGIDLDERVVDLTQFEHLQPWFLALNPNAEVPVLVDAGSVIRESSVINEYLEERYPQPGLLPTDPALRAQVRIWNKYVDANATVAIARPTYQQWVRPNLPVPAPSGLRDALARVPQAGHRARWQTIAAEGFDAAQLAEAWRVVEQMFDRMEAMLATGRCLVGDTYTLADLETTPIVVRAIQLGRADLCAGRPGVAAWFERVQRMPNFGRTYGSLDYTPVAAASPTALQM